MKYNILIIDNDANSNYTILNSLNSTELSYATTSDMITWFYITHKIHVIIVNEEIISLDKLLGIFDEHMFEYQDIPILSVNSKESLNNKLLIYDTIDINNEQLLLNKIKFCQNMYKKQLHHEANIQKILYIDSLTHLPNRNKLLQDAKDDIGITALAIIDINSFKDINEFFGLKVGDNILKSIVGVIDNLIKFIRDKVKLYKFPSDVYCLANIKLENKEFEEIVLFILGAIEAKVFHEDEHDIDIRAKAGITFSNKKNKLVTADIALKEAKKRNKEYLVFYEELDNLSEYNNNMLWTRKLKYAMDNDNMVLYYQPLVNNETKKVDKYECLVRMIDDEKIISPFFFLDISKKANQYRNLTKVIIEKAFIEFEDKEFEFSINISYEDIEDKYFLMFIKEKLKRYDVANRVVWEILEDESIKDYGVLIEFIKEIKSLGCKIAIDDFGTGYSNFEHILKMNVDYLKIDASLIKNVATDANNYKVVKAIIEFAKSLELKTISEYVESKEIFDITKDLGATYSQGYYFSAPIEKPSLNSF